jgi:hypothetical protein
VIVDDKQKSKPTPKWVVRLGWTSLVLIAASPLVPVARIMEANYAEYNSINWDLLNDYLGGALTKGVLMALVVRALWYRYKHPEMETFGSFKALWRKFTKRSNRG